MKKIYLYIPLFFILVAEFFSISQADDSTQKINIKLHQSTVSIDPNNLSISFKPDKKSELITIVSGDTAFLHPKSITNKGEIYEIRYDNYNVTISNINNSINFKIYPNM